MVLNLSAVKGGGDLPALVETSPAAFVAAALQVWPSVVQRCRTVGWSEVDVHQCLPIEEAIEAQVLLREQGVFITVAGAVMDAEPVEQLSWNCLPRPRRGIFGQITEILQQKIEKRRHYGF